MPFVPAPNIVQVEWRCTRDGQQIENRLMVNMLAEPTHNQLVALADEMWDWWENIHSAHLAIGVLLREVVVTYLGEENGLQFSFAPDATTTGALSGAALPNECSFCVSLRSGNRGRSARGRWYTLSVVLDQMVSENYLTSTAVGLFVADLDALISTIGTLGYLPVIVSYRTNNAPRVGGPVYFVITNATAVDAGVDSMRRRKPGVGS